MEETFIVRLEAGQLGLRQLLGLARQTGCHDLFQAELEEHIALQEQLFLPLLRRTSPGLGPGLEGLRLHYERLRALVRQARGGLAEELEETLDQCFRLERSLLGEAMGRAIRRQGLRFFRVNRHLIVEEWSRGLADDLGCEGLGLPLPDALRRLEALGKGGGMVALPDLSGGTLVWLPSHPFPEVSGLQLDVGPFPVRLKAFMEDYFPRLREATGAYGVELFMAHPEHSGMWSTHFHGSHAEIFQERLHFPLEVGFPGLVAHQEAVIRTRNLPEDPRYLREGVKRLGIHSYLCIPVGGLEGVHGSLQLAWLEQDAPLEQAEPILLEASTLMAPQLENWLYEVRHGPELPAGTECLYPYPTP